MKETFAKKTAVAHPCYNLFVPLASVVGCHKNVLCACRADL